MQCVHDFEREHGIAPDVVYINPFHYDRLRRYHPGLFGTSESARKRMKHCTGDAFDDVVVSMDTGASLTVF